MEIKCNYQATVKISMVRSLGLFSCISLTAGCISECRLTRQPQSLNLHSLEWLALVLFPLACEAQRPAECARHSVI